MKGKYNKIGAITFLLTAMLLISACPKDNSRVQDIAVTIEVTSETVVDEGLRFLDRNAPEQLPLVVGDLQVVVSQIALYNDGKATVGEFITTFTAVLDRLNERAEILDNEQAGIILRTVSRAGRIVEQYFNEVDLPSEVSIYANALAAGIMQGMDAFIPITPPPPLDGEPLR